ncbi:Glu/Leu/Phe/Val dehydrogenase [Geomonas sp. Red69]|uniref:Glu/Leu/Phe/Val family dehydrogenase n=1 Tax=Geomonas diazotrophica TaxID=2843197 RepID=UPI001C123E98|nr:MULTISPECIES: Glu/Leu/Phe/Val dehydrogenase [Geomonas]MBU5637422.1 Glu/Leu/Phe/Val dehydrogenase [Geomonas diazotrophica]QXE87050.1 Glu/Leu/Phe/Val dehydrogenase [Geomonas nitrogeniifigens]
MTEICCDELGPSRVIHLYSPKERLRAFVVIDNTALGPAVGGVRVSPTVGVEEVARLARAMTLKNAAAGLQHGGAKAGIVADPSDPRKERIFRVFARMIKDLTDYIPGPDMGCDETAMAWIRNETGRSLGLPAELGGLPLDRLGATGFGVAECAEVAAGFARVELKGARVAIAGFGSVGKAAARFLSEKGALLVGASDSRGAVHDPAGIDLAALVEVKRRGGSVADYGKGDRLSRDEIFAVSCDILVPAATPDVIHRGNVGQVQARLILQGANIPCTAEAEKELQTRGTVVVPDFIANAGGVIMAAMEYAGRNEQEAFAAIAQRIRKNTRVVLERAAGAGILPREAADALARERVEKAMSFRDY